MRLGLAVVATVGTALLGGGPAAAHTGLVSSSPEDGAELEEAPREVRLTFSEPVNAEFAVIQLVVYGVPGMYLEVGQGPDDRTVAATAPVDAGPGRWRIDYRVTSVDGHPVEGSFGFEVGGDPSAGPGSGATPEVIIDPAPPPRGSATDIRQFTVAVGATLLLLLTITLLRALLRRRRSGDD